MKRNLLRSSAVFASAVLFSAAAMLGQFGQWGLISPEVHPDHTVTFRIESPKAEQVSVVLESGEKFPLAKDEKGVWSVTTPAITPDIYSYFFLVDGRQQLDTQNTVYKQNMLFAGNVLDVPADTPSPWDQTDIPHGVVHHHFYKSAIVGDQRDFFVYTPPGYNAKTKYPVLYLLHGFSDRADAWTVMGKANLILDSLIHDGKAKPMIIVMPLGYGVSGYAARGTKAFTDTDLTERNFVNFRKALFEEVLPQVEASYSVSKARTDRAIAGLSMGGSESLFTGLNNIDKFAYVGSFSMGGLTNAASGKDYARIFPALAAKTPHPPLNLLWIACGTSDGLLDGNHQVIAWLKTEGGLNPVPIETPGAHTFMVWRRNLIAFAPLLFQSK